MKIAYVTHTRFPTEKAHGHQVMQVCSALASLGHEVHLIAPTVGDASTIDPFTYYGFERTFQVDWLKNFDALSSAWVPGALSFHVSMRSYSDALDAFFHDKDFDLLYARSPAIIDSLVSTFIPTIIELHTIPKRNLRTFVKDCNRCTNIVALTHPMRGELCALGVHADRVLVEGDGVQMDRFSCMPSQDDAKRTYALPRNRVVIGYVGSLATFDRLGKGVDIVVDALSLLKDQGRDVYGLIVGGPEKWMKQLQTQAFHRGLSETDIQFHPPVPSSRVAEALSAIDICIYPAPDSPHPYFQRDTSPLKLFEYLAACRPVVCADIPPLGDIVNETSVWLTQPGDPREIARAVEAITDRPDEAMDRVQRGHQIAKEHDWKKRMERILKHCL